ncbi:MAG: ATP-binding protein [Ignavibacteriaceae bacterium]|jgi:serine/threonine-protein kinase RsbW
MRVAELAANKKNISELIVKSRTENLSLIRDFISSKASTAGLIKEDIENIMLAVDEACTNIIKHAYSSYPDGEIVIKLEFNSEKILISIIDKGSTFNPDSVPDPDLQKYYKNGRVGGLGMYLMKTLMDDVKYISVPGEYNKVLLSKKISSAQN